MPGRPDWKSLRDPLLERAQRDSGRLAYAFGGERLTFGDLAERAAVRGAALQQRGIGQGNRVALALPTGLPLIETFWAVQLLGAVPCILNPEVPQQTLKRRLDGVRPSCVVTDESAAEMSRDRRRLTVPDLTGDDLAFLQLTSGTSGEPRAAMIRHRHALAYQHRRGLDGHVVADDVLVNWMPPWHDFGLVCFLISAVYFGVCCHQLEPRISVLPDWLSTIGEVGGTYTGGPDFAYRLAARVVDSRRVDLSPLRIALNGAEPVRWSTIEQFEARFSAPGVILPAYGLAEATVGVTHHLPGEERVVDARGNVSCGKPIGDIKVRAGSNFDAADEILVRGDWVFAGYFDAEPDTHETLRSGWLHTGDSGYLDTEGRLFVLGRRSTLIKRAGGFVAPRELEEAAQRVAGVRIAAAISVPGRADGDELVVVVEARPPHSPARLRREVSQAVLDALGFAPNRVVVVDPRAIPRSETGKIRYGVLQNALREGTIG
jgi:acyl-CoA synthetase (AMP-forming)/AMP-acid ligase II